MSKDLPKYLNLTKRVLTRSKEGQEYLDHQVVAQGTSAIKIPGIRKLYIYDPKLRRKARRSAKARRSVLRAIRRKEKRKNPKGYSTNFWRVLYPAPEEGYRDLNRSLSYTSVK